MPYTELKLCTSKSKLWNLRHSNVAWNNCRALAMFSIILPLSVFAFPTKHIFIIANHNFLDPHTSCYHSLCHHHSWALRIIGEPKGFSLQVGEWTAGTDGTFEKQQWQFHWCLWSHINLMRLRRKENYFPMVCFPDFCDCIRTNQKLFHIIFFF